MYTERANTQASAASISRLPERSTWPRRIGTRATSQNSATVSGIQPHMPTTLVRSTSAQT